MLALPVTPLRRLYGMFWVAGRRRIRIPRAPRNVGPGLLGHRPPVQEQLLRGIRDFQCTSCALPVRVYPPVTKAREERAFWVYQLHSNLLNSIGAAIAQSRVCEQAVSTGTSDCLLEVRRLQSILADLEATTRDLARRRSGNLPAGLLEGLSRIAAEFQVLHPAIQLELRSRGEGERVQRQAVSAARVVLQEALANAARHGIPSRIEVDITLDPRSLLLRVRDNGCGFDLRSVVNRGGSECAHWGFRIMQEYAEMANGRIEVSSAVGRGTQVTLHIALQHADTPD